MAAPVPPQGNQQLNTAKPAQVYAEQYEEGQPPPVGAVINPVGAEGELPLFTDGLPRVRVAAGWVVLAPTDYVITSRYTGAVIDVLSAEEFAERFVGPSAELEAT